MQSMCFISLILPIRNESLYIQKVLDAVIAQDYPIDLMEVLVADGMSVDDTRKIIYDFYLQHPQLKIKILDNPGSIVSTGMNIALLQAKGEIIIRVDGHCIIAPDYVTKCVEHIQRDGVDGVGGPMESIGETYVAQAVAIGMSSPFGVGNSAFRTTSNKNMFVDTIPFPAYTRHIIEHAGLYDEELIRNQDDEYNYRIRELGGNLLLAENVRSTYFGRTSLKGLWSQYYQYGYWKVRVLQKHPHQMSLRQFVPFVFILTLFFSIFLAFSSTLRFLSLLIPFMYIGINLAASFWSASRRNWHSLPLLPMIFAILHLSYGIGFLVGLVKFLNRWGDKIGKVPPFIFE